MPDDQPQTSRVSFTVPDAMKMDLNKLAMSRSDPGDRVFVAELAREALRDYLEKHDDDPEAVAPRERGALGAGNDETGVA